MSKRQAGRFAAQGRLDEAVACALVNPSSPGSADVLSTYGPETSLADLACKDQTRLMLTADDAKRISEIMETDCSRKCAERNISLVALYSRSVSLDTLAACLTDLIPSDQSESLVIDMINTGKLVDAKIDQVRRVVSFGSTPLISSSATRELDILAADIEKSLDTQ